MHPRFLRGFLFTTAGVVAGIAAFSLFLIDIGELNLPSVVARQRASGNTILYASGVEADFYRYKSLLYADIRPEVTAIGSSRAMQVRAEFFNRPFMTWGGAAVS